MINYLVSWFSPRFRTPPVNIDTTISHRLSCLFLMLITSIPLYANHGPNGYHINNYHKNWASVYSTSIVGATTANTDGTGLMLLCNVSNNNCVIRLDLLGSCSHNGKLPLRFSIDGKHVHKADFSCMGTPVHSPAGYGQAILISNFDLSLHAAMKKGSSIKVSGKDAKNQRITMNASLLGYTAATNAIFNR